MIPSRLEAQIRDNIAATKTASLLACMFSRINQRTETAAKEREDDKLKSARYWWQERKENE